MHYRNKALKQRVERLEAYHFKGGDHVLIATVNTDGRINLSGNGFIPGSFYSYKQIEDMMNKFDYYNNGSLLNTKLQEALEQANVKTVIIDDMAYAYQET